MNKHRQALETLIAHNRTSNVAVYYAQDILCLIDILASANALPDGVAAEAVVVCQNYLIVLDDLFRKHELVQLAKVNLIRSTDRSLSAVENASADFENISAVYDNTFANAIRFIDVLRTQVLLLPKPTLLN